MKINKEHTTVAMAVVIVSRIFVKNVCVEDLQCYRI